MGPLLRYVDETTAAVWVEASEPCTVRVLDTETPTFTVHGHHYALVELTGLTPGTRIPYTMSLNGEQVWPEHGSKLPPPMIRTLDPASDRLRLVFGSCRRSVPHDAKHNRTYGFDVLRAYARRLATAAEEDWPTAVLLLGDQVYADATSQPMQDFLRARRNVDEPPGMEIADFEEYTELYRLAFSEQWIRWLLSTVPSAMIFDDHDIRDDWNTSRVWRQQMARQPWWRKRVTGGLGAYWLYQHLGNLSPADRAEDAVYNALRRGDGDIGHLLDEFAYEADRNPSSNRWSYTRDFGRVRLVMVDSRCARELTPKRRSMLDENEWSWLAENVRSSGGKDHLLIGTSLPYLLPVGLHHIESWNEAVAEGHWGRKLTRFGESVRQGVDLEHWAAFGSSFDRLADLVTDAATAPDSPATVTFLSGDVHFSYAARASFPTGSPTNSRIWQLVCSPIRNPLARTVRFLSGFAAIGLAKLIGRGLAWSARVPSPHLDWSLESGPRFENALATLELSGRSAHARWETAKADDDDKPHLTELASLDL